MSSSAKPRQPRLRASCDGCFLAKVKCSKARPVCSRCLACGIVCHYSPSSRSGKPKPDSNHNTHSNPPHDQQMHAIMDDKTIAFLQQTAQENMYPIETNWATPPASSVDGSMSRNSSLAPSLPLGNMKYENAMSEQDPMSAPPDLYSGGIPWTPPTDLACTTFPEMSVPANHMQGSHGRSQSFDGTMPIHMPMPMAMSIPMQMQMQIPWGDSTPQDMVSYTQVQTPNSVASNNYFPSPTTTPIAQPPLSYQQGSGPCACFSTCLQALLALHNISSTTQNTFDQILTVNRRAVDGCSTMLGCTTCLNRPGVDTATMLLATAIGKIASVYRTTTQSYAESGAMTMLEGTPSGNMSNGSLGPYQLNGEDGKWIKMEILASEIRKLEELFLRFRDVCREVFDDSDISKAMINYTSQNIGSTLGVVNHRKSDTSFSVASH
ncbi:hypothetical protein GGR58DRAFT_315954 [Xylaria digitata]|nr:hypothetical protein GGR58DRAFT_315954 [Xylaria digitata]